MDEAKLQEIEARANAATPGPWHARTGRTYADGKVTSVEHYVARGGDDVGIASEVCDSRTGDPSADNALFLAAARADVPALVAEVRRLTAALDAARRDEHCRPVQVVAGVAVRGGRVLLIRSKRHGVATPGGKVRIGETHADALRRELREETGLEVVRVGRYLHTDVQPAFQCHLYAVEVSESEPVAGDDAEAAWWGDPAEILASNIPRDYPLVLDVIRSGIGTHDDAPWFAAALATARREGAEAMREALIVRFTQRVEYLHPWAEAEDDENGYHSGAWTEALNAVQFTRDMVLPLDAPGGAS